MLPSSHAGQALPRAARPDWHALRAQWDGFRCIVFRDGDEVPSWASRNEKDPTRYFPELPRLLKANLPARCVVRPGRSSSRRQGAGLSRPSSAHPPGRVAHQHAGRDHARLLRWPSTVLAMGDDDRCHNPSPSAAPHASGPWRRPAARHLTPATPTQTWRPSGSTGSRGGAGRRGGQAALAPVQGGRAGHAQGQARPHGPTAVVAGYRVTQGRRRSGGSLSWGRYDDEGKAPPRGRGLVVQRRAPQELNEEVTPYKDRALEGHPWRDWAEARPRPASRGRNARSGDAGGYRAGGTRAGT